MALPLPLEVLAVLLLAVVVVLVSFLDFGAGAGFAAAAIRGALTALGLLEPAREVEAVSARRSARVRPCWMAAVDRLSY